jgi:proteic killer suppression protein
VIKGFRHKGLARFFQNDDATGIRADLSKRCRSRLTALDVAESLADLNFPGFNFHRLRGKPERYSIHVNGPWAITFEWIDGDAWRVDLEQYH